MLATAATFELATTHTLQGPPVPRTSRPSSERMTTMTFEPPPSAQRMRRGRRVATPLEMATGAMLLIGCVREEEGEGSQTREDGGLSWGQASCRETRCSVKVCVWGFVVLW